MLASHCAKCSGFVIRECLDPASVCLMCGKQVWDSPGDPIPKGKRHCDPKQSWYVDKTGYRAKRRRKLSPSEIEP